MKRPVQTTRQVSPVEANVQEQALLTEEEEYNESSGSSSKASKASTRSLLSKDFPSLLSLSSPARASENESEIDNNLEISREDNGSGRRRRGVREIWDKWNRHSNFNLRSNINDEECSEVTDDTEHETQDCLDSVFGLDLETPKGSGSNFPVIPGKSDQGTADVRDRTLLTGSDSSSNDEDGNGTRKGMKVLSTSLNKVLTGSKQYSPSCANKPRKKSVQGGNGFHPALHNYTGKRNSGDRRSLGGSWYDDSENLENDSIGKESMKGSSGHDIDTYSIEGFLHLRFRSAPLEKAFMDSYSEQVVPRIIPGIIVLLLLNLTLLISEAMFDYHKQYSLHVIISRCASISLMVGVWFALRYVPLAHRFASRLGIVTYVLLFFIIIFESIMGMNSGLPQKYAFLIGQWTHPYSLFLTAIAFHMSGLLYSHVMWIVGWFYASMVLTQMCFFWSTFVEGLLSSKVENLFIPALSGMCVLSAHRLQLLERHDFALRCTLSEERKKLDNVVNSMLPPKVSELLQNGVPVADVTESFEKVTILFGYIAGFKELTISVPGVELLAFMNSLFEMLDEAAEKHNVYKLEAIEASYLCCTGASETEELKGGLHADSIVEMGLTMLAVALYSRLPLMDGQTKAVAPELMIGIHTGPAIGGVTGAKSYGYHLFGDSINTASRMGSTGIKMGLQLSSATYNSLSQKYKDMCVARGGVNIKGKGVMNTYIVKCSRKQLGLRYYELLRYSNSKELQYDADPMKLPTYSPEYLEVQKRKMVESMPEAQVENIRVKHLKFKLTNCGAVGEQSKQELESKLESEFIDHYNNSRYFYLQRTLICVVGWTGISLSISYDRDKELAVDSAFFGLFSVLVCTYLASFLSIIPYMQITVSITACIYFFLMNLDILDIVDLDDQVAFNIIAIVVVSLLVDLRCRSVAIANTINFISFAVLCLIEPDEEVEYLAGYLVFVLLCSIAGVMACYNRDYELRNSFLHQQVLESDKYRSNQLLSNMLPNPTHTKKLLEGKPVVDDLADITMLFCDLQGYTGWAAKQPPAEVYRILNKVYTAFDSHLEPLGVYKIDIVGDAFIAVGGLDGFRSREEHPMVMVHLAFRILFELERIKFEEHIDFDMRVGIHTGRAIGAVVGTRKQRYLTWGKTVLIAKELEANCPPGKVMISSCTFWRLPREEMIDAGMKYSVGKSVVLSTRSGTETITTHVIELKGIKAYTRLAEQIQKERCCEASRMMET